MDTETVEANVQLLNAVDDFCWWIVSGKISTCVPKSCGVPFFAKDLKKLKKYHEKYNNDFWKY
jgi:hypothetical protein